VKNTDWFGFHNDIVDKKKRGLWIIHNLLFFGGRARVRTADLTIKSLRKSLKNDVSR
jgi:hypothetical protein